MRSVSLLRYNSEMQCFELEARDQKSSWMLAIEMFSEDFYIGAENNYNLFTVSWQPDSLHDYDRSRLKASRHTSPDSSHQSFSNMHILYKSMLCCASLIARVAAFQTDSRMMSFAVLRDASEHFLHSS